MLRRAITCTMLMGCAAPAAAHQRVSFNPVEMTALRFFAEDRTPVEAVGAAESVPARTLARARAKPAKFRGAMPVHFSIASSPSASSAAHRDAHEMERLAAPAYVLADRDSSADLGAKIAAPSLARDERELYSVPDGDLRQRRRGGLSTKLVFRLNSAGTQTLGLGGVAGRLLNAVPHD